MAPRVAPNFVAGGTGGGLLRVPVPVPVSSPSRLCFLDADASSDTSGEERYHPGEAAELRKHGEEVGDSAAPAVCCGRAAWTMPPPGGGLRLENTAAGPRPRWTHA